MRLKRWRRRGRGFEAWSEGEYHLWRRRNCWRRQEGGIRSSFNFPVGVVFGVVGGEGLDGGFLRCRRRGMGRDVWRPCFEVGSGAFWKWDVG